MSLLGALVCGAVGGALFGSHTTKHVHHYHESSNNVVVHEDKPKVKIVPSEPLIGLPSDEVYENIKSNLFSRDESYNWMDILDEVYMYALYGRVCTVYAIYEFNDAWVKSGVLKQFLDNLVFGANFEVQLQGTELWVRDAGRTLKWSVFDLLNIGAD